MREDYVKFDRAKFKAVVHYICANTDPDELGNVKLHKVLYFADMLHFASTGTPLTGVDYLKQKFGPVARNLSKAVEELQQDGKLRVEVQDYFGFDKKRYVSIAPPTVKMTNEEARLLGDVMAYVCGRSARAISELSHDAAWSAAVLGERIPYAAALGLGSDEITDADIEAGIADARRLRPEIDAQHALG